MLIVAVSRGLVIPVYLTQLGKMELAPQTMAWFAGSVSRSWCSRFSRAASSSSRRCCAGIGRKPRESGRRSAGKRAAGTAYRGFTASPLGRLTWHSRKMRTRQCRQISGSSLR